MLMNCSLFKLLRPQFICMLVYIYVSLKRRRECKRISARETVQKWLIRSMNDHITILLMKNSHLTKTQLETLLIDFLAANIASKPLKNEEKAQFRLFSAKISRGAFNRTLKQARNNVIHSIYTIILLGYLGMFENTRLEPYLEIANRLKDYISAYKNMPSDEDQNDEYLKIVSILREELEKSLEQLSTTRTLSET